ncbi:glycoside hydrolase family 1 [Fonsecaea pedrosoi]|nr:glycoside hydrolase family 1 [Fonsecaea pedrosoi]
MASWLSILSFALGSATAQQYYIPVSGTSARPQCTATPSYSQPTYSPYSDFAYSMTETVRTATSVQPGPTTTYAPPAASLTSLLSSLSFTTWGKWDPNATDSATDTDNPYGDAAWTALWQMANPPNFTETSVFSTTVSPTPIPTSELVLPPPDYFGPTDCYYFPADFQFGVAGSAAQIEGAAADEGKGPSLMDILIQDDRPKDYVTNENYYYYKQEIERLASMGVKYYSFSLAWSRILPFALPGTPVNQQGLDHYSDLIDFVLEKGMIPTVTILHFDTPAQFFAANFSAAQAKPLIGYSNGGYQNETFVDAYVNYAKIVMTYYADRVPIWFTFNEPFIYSFNGLSVDHVLKAHAQVYHFYKESIGGTGKVSLKFNDNFGVPRDPANANDVYAADHFNSFQLGMFCNPIFLGQDYPDSYKETVPDYVPLSPEDLAYINGTADFLGIDPYTATVVSPPVADSLDSIHECCANSSSTYFPYCVNQSTLTTTGWNIGYRSQSYVYITPRYLRLYLSYLYNTFHTPIVITEFGFPVFGEDDKTDLSDQLSDLPRSIYYLSYMSEVLKSIWEDGVHVAGAFAWSFADNWEFGDYTAHFGIQTVNRTTQQRRYKKSFFDLVDFVNSRTMPQQPQWSGWSGWSGPPGGRHF